MVIRRCHTIIWINTSGNRVHLQIRVRLLWIPRTRKMRIFHRSVYRKCWMTSTLLTTLLGRGLNYMKQQRGHIDLFRYIWCGDWWNIYSNLIYFLWAWIASFADFVTGFLKYIYILLFDINFNKDTCLPSKYWVFVNCMALHFIKLEFP